MLPLGGGRAKAARSLPNEGPIKTTVKYMNEREKSQLIAALVGSFVGFILGFLISMVYMMDNKPQKEVRGTTITPYCEFIKFNHEINQYVTYKFSHCPFKMDTGVM